MNVSRDFHTLQKLHYQLCPIIMKLLQNISELRHGKHDRIHKIEYKIGVKFTSLCKFHTYITAYNNYI